MLIMLELGAQWREPCVRRMLKLSEIRISIFFSKILLSLGTLAEIQICSLSRFVVADQCCYRTLLDTRVLF